jgi:hypothetical protein
MVGMLNDATGEVSDRPYPSRIMQPNLSSKERMTSSGIAEPPEAQVRRLEASMPSELGWLRMAAYIVGTPCMIVTRSFSMTSMAAAGSNRGMSARDAPATVAALRPTTSPNTWKSGRQPITTSSGVISWITWAERVALRWMLRWVSSAPLGRPVVPEV